MPLGSDDEEVAAPLLSCFTTPTKANSNDGASHASSDAEETESELDSDAKKEFDELTGKKRKKQGYFKFMEVKRWSTSADPYWSPSNQSLNLLSH
jgi:hypothetical protein